VKGEGIKKNYPSPISQKKPENSPVTTSIYTETLSIQYRKCAFFTEETSKSKNRLMMDLGIIVNRFV